MQSEQPFHQEVLHGRQARIYPAVGTDIVFIVFQGQGEIPDYDVYNRVEDVPYGLFLHQCVQQNRFVFAGNGLLAAEPVEQGQVHRTKISSDFADFGKALLWREKEVSKKTVTRERGALYLVEDQNSGKWSVWLETWADFFARSHTSPSREWIERDAHLTALQRQEEKVANEAVAAVERANELSKPSTKVVLILVGVLLIWGITRLLGTL